MVNAAEYRKTHKKSYDFYMNSFAWMRKRQAALKAADYRCQYCKKDSLEVSLEVHHLTYKNFTREEPEDLQVLCVPCHKIADEARRTNVQIKNTVKLYDAQLDGWASKVYGEHWQDDGDPDYAREKFNDWLEEKGEY